MPVSKSPEQDKQISDRVINTLDLKPHENTKYYEFLDKAYHTLNANTPALDKSALHDYYKDRHPEESVHLSAFPAINAAKSKAQSDFFSDMSTLSPDDHYLAHQAWEDATAHTSPQIEHQGLQHAEWTWKPHPDLPVEQTASKLRVKTGKIKFEDMAADYKTHSAHPGAIPFHYIVNRIINLDKYENAEPPQRKELDSDWQKKTSANLKEPNPTVFSTARMKRFIVENPDMISTVLQHQRDFHNVLKSNFGYAIQDVNGEPHIALSRGLDSAEHGEDRPLASYAWTGEPNFGKHTFRYLVPLNHAWYSYDFGPKDSRWSDIGPEREVIVDNQHPRTEHVGEWPKTPVPDWHSYDTSGPLTWSYDALKKAIKHNIIANRDVPDWMASVNPKAVTDLVASLDARSVTPDIRQKLAKLPIGSHDWINSKTSIGADIAHNYKDTNLSDSQLQEIAKFNPHWIGLRYKGKLPLNLEHELVAHAIAIDSSRPYVEALAARPDLSPESKQKLQQALQSDRIKYSGVTTPWLREALFGGAK